MNPAGSPSWDKVPGVMLRLRSLLNCLPRKKGFLVYRVSSRLIFPASGVLSARGLVTVLRGGGNAPLLCNRFTRGWFCDPAGKSRERGPVQRLSWSLGYLPSDFHSRAEVLHSISPPGPQLILKSTSVSSPAEITAVCGFGTVTQFEPEIPANSTSYAPTGTLSN